MKIDSIKDPRIVSARQLAHSKGRLESNKFLLEGQEQIQWAFNLKVTIETVFVHDKIEEHILFKDFEKLHIPYFFVTDGILKKITDTNYCVPIVAVANNPVIHSIQSEDFTLVLDNLVDYGNIGTIVRSAAAFGLKTIISTNTHADFFYKKIIDASRGKIFEANIKKFNTDQDTLNYLKTNGYQIIATSPHAQKLQSLIELRDKPIALILGNETEGCSQNFIDQADLLIQIPMSSDIESLNVAVAAGISIYELKMKLVIAMLIQKIYKNLGRQFGITHALIRQAFETELHKVTELSVMHVILLMILKCDQHMSLDQVAKDAGESEKSLEFFLNPLTQAGYINKVIEKGASGIILTKLGEEFAAKIWPVVEKSEEKILENFSDIEKAQLIEYISRIQTNCNKIISDAI